MQDSFSKVSSVDLTFSPRAVSKHIVGVGTVLYLDILHASIPDEIKAELKYLKIIGTHTPTLCSAEHTLYGKNLAAFKKLCANKDEFHPVLKCMLLYEMPENVVARSSSADSRFQVWVGIRQINCWKSEHTYSTRYLSVPTKALVCADKLLTAGISMALFESCVV